MEIELIVDTRCIHDFIEGQCGICIPLPFGISETVYVSKHGRAFHIWDNCEYLEAGQKFAESKGGHSTEILSITWKNAFQNHYPCEWCCALYYSKGKNLEECLVQSPEGEVPAHIVKHRYIGRNMREFQIYYEDSGELEILTNRVVKRFK